MSNTNNNIDFEKLNPKTKKTVKVIKGVCNICGRNKSQIFTRKMTKGEDFIRNAKCKYGNRSPMSNSAWCDLNKNCRVLKLYMCHNPKFNCEKQTTFIPKQFQLEGNGFKNTMKKKFEGSQTACLKFLKPALNKGSPYIGMAVSAKTENPKIGPATANILKSISGGKILSLTDMHGHRLRLKVM